MHRMAVGWLAMRAMQTNTVVNIFFHRPPHLSASYEQSSGHPGILGSRNAKMLEIPSTRWISDREKCSDQARRLLWVLAALHGGHGDFQVAVCAKILAPIEEDVAVARAPTSELAFNVRLQEACLNLGQWPMLLRDPFAPHLLHILVARSIPAAQTWPAWSASHQPKLSVSASVRVCVYRQRGKSAQRKSGFAIAARFPRQSTAQVNQRSECGQIHST